ncbi:hypothetical protein I305_06850 [Cryptococcus gattii E566]|uniref:Uncharacterized protein n=1 Tax=Cryptococcus gattii serotype B (strain WM276 / ATCC MYA-4071) TaxID=367775 RepID=E6RF18_CRYGW|nr:Hypothetical Protein CGB_M0420C [Cryptococcus gattii WM276]ADV25424.1 Hypothetical Protein CGB_M0420C [Cryptococcus gattii WM276]KIY30770.1 hypothetical protein I305_06850 [Cryptococcus gattii E566]KJD99886.1 hypothetical protein I311_06532 [Cryptococcus gattii NT-10]
MQDWHPDLFSWEKYHNLCLWNIWASNSSKIKNGTCLPTVAKFVLVCMCTVKNESMATAPNGLYQPAIKYKL